MKKNTLLEMVNFLSKKTTKIVFLSIFVLSVLNMSAQMSVTIPGVPGDYAGSEGGNIAVDIDGDGNNDVNISSLLFSGVYIFGAEMARSPTNTGGDDRILGDAVSINVGEELFFPHQLSSGTTIGASSTTWNTHNNEVLYTDLTVPTGGGVGVIGQWSPGTTGFLGVKFSIGANTHYGWLNITFTTTNDWTINSWGYNETPDASAFINTPISGGEGGNIAVDIDGDGNNDVNISCLLFSGVYIFGAEMARSPANTGGDDRILGDAVSINVGEELFFPHQLSSGTTIGASSTTWNTHNNEVLYTDLTVPTGGGVGVIGQWALGTTGFLGVKFSIGANTHYGWLNITFTNTNDWTINTWGYNATPDQNAVAGEVTLKIQKNEFSSNVLVYTKDNKITIKNLQEAADYSLYSITGQAVQKGVVQKGNSEISASTLSSGIYILKALGKESGKLLTAKLAF